MKTLKFRHNLAEEIVADRKTVTWRLFDDKDLKVGEGLELIDRESGEKFAEAKIVKIRVKKLGEIEDEDFEGHEKFTSKEEMLATYKKYYGDKVGWSAFVKIIEFKLL
jgi:hypothetical protein